jgi:hypothetical protein
MLQLFHLDVAKVDRGMLHMLQVFQMNDAIVCSKCFICFQTYVAIIFYLDVAYVSHICCNYMLQNISAVLVLCCIKWFHVASCKCYFWMFHVFYTHVANACSKCFICVQIYVASKKKLYVTSVLCCLARGEPEVGDDRSHCRGGGPVALSPGPSPLLHG